MHSNFNYSLLEDGILFVHANGIQPYLLRSTVIKRYH